MTRKILRFFLPFVALALGVAMMIGLVKTKPKASKAARDDRGTVVEVLDATVGRKPVVVKAHGTVIPARSVTIGPEVSGKVTWVAEGLEPGGRFGAGQPLLRLDGRDYKLALAAQSAAVNQAETALALEERRKRIAEREWELMGKQGDPLTLQEKQLKTAEVAVSAARSNAKRAQLAVGRTVIKAPFNAIVQERRVDIGQILAPAAPVITLAGTDEFWVQISVPIERLAWINIPGVNVAGASKASKAVVWRELNGQRVEREGTVVRLLGDVDPMGRMARLLVSIANPLAPRAAEQPVVGDAVARSPGLPLLLGSFVQVDITGRSLESVVEIPREALRDGDTVFVMKPEKVDIDDNLRGMLSWAGPDRLAELTTIHRLDIRPVQVVWRQRETVYVRAGLEPGEQIITSPVPSPIQGIKLRLPDLDDGDGAAGGSKTAESQR